MGISDVCANCKPLVQVYVKACARVDTAGIRDRKDTGFVVVPGTQVVADVLGTARNADLVVLVDTGLVCFIGPVMLVGLCLRNVDVEFLRILPVFGGVHRL